jgi:hypothetical protein
MKTVIFQQHVTNNNENLAHKNDDATNKHINIVNSTAKIPMGM